ncbi:hypothetical protein FB451DRAFT_1388337 [Mycena latifolia]|nr:hypothetical protein FB451DRAFT_1388337 [Mycena latifolia]
MRISNLAAPLGKIVDGIKRSFDNKDVLELSYTIALLKAENAELKTAALELWQVNELLEADIVQLAKEADEKAAEAAYYSALSVDQQTLIEFGVKCVEEQLEDVHRSDAQTRDTQLQFMEELKAKDNVIGLQAAQLKAFLEADAAAKIKIAELEAKVIKEAGAHRAHLSSIDDAAQLKISALEARLLQDTVEHAAKLKNLEHTQAARDSSSALIIANQASKIAALNSTINKLEAGAAAALLAEASQADAIKGLEAVIQKLRATGVATRIAEDARAAADAKSIRKRNGKIAKMEKSATEMRGKDAVQAAKIDELEARVKRLQADAVEVAHKAVVNQLCVTELVQGLEQRVVAAEERAKKTQEEGKATIAHLAVRHAKELAASRVRLVADTDVIMAHKANTPLVNTQCQPTDDSDASIVILKPITPVPPSTVDFSLDCEYHFSTRFVVRADSAIAQASIAAPAPFIRTNRKIVRRGGNSEITPLLLPAWPERGGRVEDSRCTRRS